MTTAYTAFIEDGRISSPDDFLMLCARAFGACSSMREDPLSTPIPKEFEKNSSLLPEIMRIEKELSRLLDLSQEEKVAEAEKAIKQALAEKRKELKKAKNNRKTMKAMLIAVMRWEPSLEYSNVKRFAIQQLADSLPKLKYIEDDINELLNMDEQSWIQRRIEDYALQIEVRKASLTESDNSIESANVWIRNLREEIKNLKTTNKPKTKRQSKQPPMQQ